MAAHGEPQLEPQQEVTALPAQESVPMPAAPAFTPEAGIGTSARVSETPGGLRATLAAAGGGERRKFVLQLQRTAGNAAVCRWLGIGRGHSAQTAAEGEDWSDVEAWLAEASGGEDGDEGEPDAARAR